MDEGDSLPRHVSLLMTGSLQGEHECKTLLKQNNFKGGKHFMLLNPEDSFTINVTGDPTAMKKDCYGNR